MRGCRLAAVLSLSALASTAGCARPDDTADRLAGAWALQLGTRTFAVLELTERRDGVTGTFTMPDHFEVGQPGFRFTQISNHVAQRPISNVTIQGDRVHFRCVNPRDAQDVDELDFTLTARNEATLKIADAPFDPWVLKRSPRGSLVTVSTDWEPTRSYSQEDGVPSSVEMQRIFEADQKPRLNWASLSDAQRADLDKDDARRRDQTRQLLARGQLHTGEDFKRAAFIFQHGSTADDYMLAHTLAMVALANGDAGGLWIATATLDRYLQATGQPQVYGTQFKPDAGGSMTQEPYNPALISDALRRQLGVPSLVDQKKQALDFAKTFAPRK